MNDDARPDEAAQKLLQRMQAADPARKLHPTSSSTTDLMEATMNTTPSETTPGSHRWAPALVAAATVAVLGGTSYAVLGDKDPADTPSSTSPAATSTTLAMPAGSGTSMTSCLPFDVQYLRDMPVALSGTATEVGDDGVILEVDRWYTGGEADVVRLENDDENVVSLDGISFEQGSRYLVTATAGTVNVCGYSGPWSRDLADAYDEAFDS